MEYEQEKKNKEIENNGQHAELDENSNFSQRLRVMGKEKKEKKIKYGENEIHNINSVFISFDLRSKKYKRKATRSTKTNRMNSIKKYKT